MAQRKRPYRVLHQKVVIEVDIENESIVGFTDISILPLADNVRHIGLNCSQLEPLEVQVDGQPAQFHRRLPHTASFSLEQTRWQAPKRSTKALTAELNAGATPTLNQVRDLMSLELSALEQRGISSHGSLVVGLPSGKAKPSKQPSATPAAADGNDEMDVDISSITPSRKRAATMQQWPQLAGKRRPICLRVGYRVRRPDAGLQFVLPTAACPGRTKHMYTCTDKGDVSTWLPCVDSIEDRFAVDLEVTCAAEYVCVASGELSAQVYTNERTRTHKTWLYKCATPILARGIGFAIGPFSMVSAVSDHAEAPTTVMHFNLAPPPTAGINGSGDNSDFNNNNNNNPAQQHLLQQNLGVLQYVEEVLATRYPYASYKQVYVQESGALLSFAGLTIMPASNHSYTETVDTLLDNQYDTALGVTTAWVHNALLVKTPSDLWISLGLGRYLAGAYFEKAFGRNEARLRQMEDRYFVVDHDIALAHPDTQDFLRPSRPLCWGETARKEGQLYDPYMWRKAGVVMSMLCDKIGKGRFENLMQQMWQLAAEASSAAAPLKPLSTKKLIRLAKRTANDAESLDMSNFFDQWVYCDGYPELRCDVIYNKKKGETELTVHQDQPSIKFRGPIHCIIHESHQTVLKNCRLDEQRTKFSFACKSKLARNRKRKKVHDESKLGVKDLLMRETDSPIRWVRVDSSLQWFQPTVVAQSEAMMIHQLRNDQDALAQWLAVDGLRRLHVSRPAHLGSERPHPALVPNALKHALTDKKLCYRVRCYAGSALIQRMPSGKINDMLRMLKKHFFRMLKHNQATGGSSIGKSSSSNSSSISSSNSGGGSGLSDNNGGGSASDARWSALTTQKVEFSLLTALSKVITPAEATPPAVTELLFELLLESDNCGNATHANQLYTAALLRCFGNLRLHPTKMALVTAELQRRLNKDEARPSGRSVVTQAALQAFSQLIRNGQANESEIRFVAYCKETRFWQVRTTAFECLVRLLPLRPSAFDDLLDMLALEVSLPVRVDMAQSWAAAAVKDAAAKEKYFDAFRKGSPDSQRRMSSLWTMLNTAGDSQLWNELTVIYRAFWGGLDPPCCTTAQRLFGQHLRQRFKQFPGQLHKESDKFRIEQRNRHRMRTLGVDGKGGGNAITLVLSR